MKKTITFPSNKIKFFRQYLEILSPFIKTLRPKELDVLGYLIYLDDKYSAVPEEDRGLIIFSAEKKKELAAYLNMSQESLNNNLSVLRSKNVIADGVINPAYCVKPDAVNEITFKLIIDDSH